MAPAVEDEGHRHHRARGIAASLVSIVIVASTTVAIAATANAAPKRVAAVSGAPVSIERLEVAAALSVVQLRTDPL